MVAWRSLLRVGFCGVGHERSPQICYSDYTRNDEFKADKYFVLKSAQSHEVTVPFEVNLVGEIVSFDPDAIDCNDEGYLGRVIVEASGNATHMGKVTMTFDFCTAGPPDPDIEGSKMTYAGFMGELVAANGDVLYLSYSGGSIIDGRRDDHPEHVYEYWVTSIEVFGGTGKFVGAKGNLTADDYCSTLDDLTHHRFFGKITLPKGKKYLKKMLPGTFSTADLIFRFSGNQH